MGHLINNEALDIFIRHRPPFMSHLLLSHLSKNNNSPELVQKIFDEHAANVKITVASRFCETEVFHIHATEEFEDVVQIKPYKRPAPMQLSLGFI